MIFLPRKAPKSAHPNKLFHIITLLSSTLMTGCVSTKQAYIDFYGEYAEMSGGINELDNTDLTGKLLINICVNLNKFALIAALVSILIGVVLNFAIKKNKNITKVAIFFFMIGLPALIIVGWLILAFIVNSTYL